MSAATAPQHPALRRSPGGGVIAGVCAGLGRRLGVDTIWIRVAFVVATIAGGFGIPIYALAWAVLPDDGSAARGRRLRTRRSAVEVALGSGFLVLAGLLTVRASGVAWFSDAITWPLVLIAAGGVLIWRTSQSEAPPAPAFDAPAAEESTVPDEVAARAGWAAAVVSRTGVGIALVVAAALVFLQATGALAAARDVALAAIVVAVALAVIFAPWIIRLARSLTQERAERIRSQERAELAAHLHDSVLQTLALVQKRADDPRAVAQLARRQERELRSWLFDRTQGEAGNLRAALEQAAQETEEAHGANVEVVAVGDRPLDDPTTALVAAAREAMVNAARHGGGDVSVYAEATPERAQVFVRDRGAGFEPAEVPSDRRGIRESIVGRMERHGGRATIHAQPGQGTEVELTLP
jgi:signal transduction histidine kinase/phage shock protein PspC (stress-responsive transcriptional regulator)